MKVTTVGIDLAKNLFQVHGVNECGKVSPLARGNRSQITRLWVPLNRTI